MNTFKVKSNLLKNRIILVTGATNGIGREAAITYAHYGANVILLGRNDITLRDVANQITKKYNLKTYYFKLDLSTCTSSDCKSLAILISKYYPRLDGVLHNAGLLGQICPIEKQDPEIWKQVIQVNVNATFFLTQALLPLLLKSHLGSLVFTSSSVGRVGRANWGAYATSKFATEGMMQVIAAEYYNKNLRVSCINPGKVYTKMRSAAFPCENPQNLKTPAEIMSIYVWIMSPYSRYSNGITFSAQPDWVSKNLIKK